MTDLILTQKHTLRLFFMLLLKIHVHVLTKSKVGYSWKCPEVSWKYQQQQKEQQQQEKIKKNDMSNIVALYQKCKKRNKENIKRRKRKKDVDGGGYKQVTKVSECLHDNTSRRTRLCTALQSCGMLLSYTLKNEILPRFKWFAHFSISFSCLSVVAF